MAEQGARIGTESAEAFRIVVIDQDPPAQIDEVEEALGPDRKSR
jgi:hypothetical protein